MIREEHLSVYDVKLTTRAPLFIGNGKTLSKTDYLLSPKESEITVLNIDKLLTYLAQHNLAEQYESFVLSRQTNMHLFLTEICGLTQEELEKLSLYKIHTADVLDRNNSLKEIHQITRTPDNQVYVPGSSLKGALRTALLLGPVMKASPLPQEHLNRSYRFREGRYANTLQYVQDKTGKTTSASISVLQGIRISDSLPISNGHIMLAAKVDVGVTGETNSLQTVWECIAPGTELHFQMTLDHSVLDRCFFDGKQGIDADRILQAVRDFASYYREQYASKFSTPKGSVQVDCSNAIWLGGNAGYFSKTLAYPYWKDRALDEVSEYMMSIFPKHGHKRYREHPIAPHKLNYALCGGKLYPMGLCEVEIT